MENHIIRECDQKMSTFDRQKERKDGGKELMFRLLKINTSSGLAVPNEFGDSI